MFGSGGGSQTIYAAPFAMGICDWDGKSSYPMTILKVWTGKKLTTLKKLNFTVFAPTANPASGWAWLQTNYPDEYLAYSNLVYVASPLVLLDSNAQIPNLSFEVQAPACCLSGQVDADPYLIIDYFLNNTYYGVTTYLLNQYSNFHLPLATCTQFKNYTRANGLFISPALTEQKAAADWLTEFARCTNSEFVWNGAFLEIIPFGDEAATGNSVTFTPDLTPLFNFTDDDFILSGEEPEDPVLCTVKPPADCCNYVQVEYVNRGNDYNVDIVQSFDQADIEVKGKRPLDVVKLHHICESYVAQQVVELLKYRSLYIRKSYTFNVGWKYIDFLRPMDLVTITDVKMGLTLALVRINAITEHAISSEGDSGYATIEAEECPLGTGSANQYSRQVIKPYTPNTGVDPGLVNTPIIFQVPPSMASGINPEVWMAVSGASEDWGGCHVWASVDDATYQQIGTISSKAKTGITTAQFLTGSDPDTSHTLAVDLTESLGELLPGTQQDADLFLTLCYVDGELIAYQDATLTTPACHYDLGTYIRRGCYGTIIGTHAASSIFARLDDAVFQHAFTPDYVGKTVYLKFTSFNIFGQAEEDIADVTKYPISIIAVPALGPVPTDLSRTTGEDETTLVRDDAFVTFVWDNIHTPLGYELIYKKTTGVTDWTSVKVPDPGVAATVSCRVGGLPVGVEYEAQVRSIMPSGPSGWATFTSITTWKETVGPVLTYVVLTATGKANLILLNWTYSTGSQEVRFQKWHIYRGTTAVFSDGTTIELDQKSAATRSYRDTSMIVSTNYWYWLKGEDRDGNLSAYCAPAGPVQASSVIVRNLNPPYDVPANVCSTTVDWIKKANRQTASVNFAWVANNPADPDGDDVKYEVDYWIQGETSAKATRVHVLKKDAVTVTVKGLEIDTIYEWTVIAIDTWGNKSNPQSPVLTVDTSHDTNYPDIACVTGISSTGLLTRIRVNWTVNATALNLITDFKEWVVYRGTASDGSDRVEYDQVSNKALRWFIDKDVDPTTVYYYWLKIRDQSGNVSAGYSSSTHTSPTSISTDSVPPTDPSFSGISTPLALTKARDNSKFYSEATATFYGSMDDNLVGYYIQLWNATDNVKVGSRHIQLAGSTDESTTQVVVELKGVFWVKKTNGTTINYYVTVIGYDKAGNKSNIISSSNVNNPSTGPATPTWATTPISGDGLSITVNINANAEVDLGGYEYHFSQSSGFTPAAGTLKNTTKATSFTWITTVGTWYCKVIAFDTENPVNKSAASTQQSITVSASLHSDTTPPTPDPPTGMSSAISVHSIGLKVLMKAALSWTACTDDSGKAVHYEVQYWKSGDSTPASVRVVFNSHTLYNLDASSTWLWKVRALDYQNNATSFCANQTLTVGTDSTAPAAPTVSGVIKGIGSQLLGTYTKNTEVDMQEYRLYVYTSNNVGAASIVKRIAHPTNHWNVKIGDISEGGVTITKNVPVYFWLSAVDVSGNESATKTYIGTITPKSGIYKNASTGIVYDDDDVAITPDHLTDGTTFGLIRRTSLTGGNVDLGLSGVAGRNLDNISDTASYRRPTPGQISGLDSSGYLTSGLRSGVKIFLTPANQVIVPSQFTNLKCDKTGSYTVSITADSISLRNGSGSSLAVVSVNVANDISQSGPVANGRDRYSAFSGSDWVNFFVICNSTTMAVASLSSVSTVPSLPSGYDYYARVGAAHMLTSVLRAYTQRNREAWEKYTTMIDTGPSAIDTYQSLNIGVGVPPTALRVVGQAGKSSVYALATSIGVASDSSGSNEHLADIAAGTPIALQLGVKFDIPLLTVQTIYWRASRTNAVFAIQVLGWTDNI